MKRNSVSALGGVRWPAAVLAAAAVILLLAVVPSRLKVENDVIAGLPAGDAVIADTRYVIRQHGILDSIFLDLSLADGSADSPILIAAADKAAAALKESGLFLSVGGREYGESLPGLLAHVTARLPQLFDESDLRGPVTERIRPERIREALREDAVLLRSLEGIGQAGLVARDPLGLRAIVLGRIGSLLPVSGARIVRGQILSSDERHVLLPAQPAAPGTDTASAGRLQAAIEAAAAGLSQNLDLGGRDIRVLSVGAFRSTLDNEKYSRQDARRAAWISLVGIAVLLLFCFPRPWLGLLCLVPAVAGTALSLFTLSLARHTLSILALGFGGALVGIVMDQGIAYFTFLDREEKATTGWEASASVWVVSLAATLTTVGSFLALQFSGFPVLRQLGLFAGLGAFFAFLFVHLVFPLVFSTVPPARKARSFRLTRLTSVLALGGGRPAAGLALLLFLVLAWFAKPRFEGDLRALNSVSPETIRAEETVREIWGDVLRSISLLVEADTPAELQARSDRLGGFLRRQVLEGKISDGFTPSMVLPGKEMAASRLAAWRSFWTPARIDAVRAEIVRSRAGLGFSERAFEPFFLSLENPASETAAIPPDLYPLLGIVRSRDGAKWMSLNSVNPVPAFDREAFAREARSLPGTRVLDYELFADHLAGLIVKGFTRMLFICIGGLAVGLFLFFFELTLPLLVLGHTAFALVCTLGTLKLLGQPLDIPGLALAVIIPGMGSDFALFFARSHQRYLDENRPAMAIYRNAVFLTAASAMIGFAGLAVGRHVLLRSIGRTGLLAVAYSALGAFVLLPPILRVLLKPRPWPAPGPLSSPNEVRSRVQKRYRHLETYARFFARFKMRFDPMFPRLERHGPDRGLVLDIGCGYGVPAAWLMARKPHLRVIGLEPHPKRAAVARHVFGERGEVLTAAAPDLPPLPAPADAALMLDVVHHLTDEDFRKTLRSLAERLRPGARLLLRATVPGSGREPWPVRLESWKWKIGGRKAYLRTAAELENALAQTGFKVECVEPCAFGPRVVWMIVGR